MCGPVFFRGAVFSCCLSIPKRSFDWGTPLGIKRVCLAKVRNDDSGPKSAWEILVCGPVFFSWCCLLLLPLNSQTKLRLGDTIRNKNSMFGKGEERRFRAEIRLGDSGVRACFFSWCCLLLLPLNSQTKLRLGDTIRNQKSMFGKGEERRFRAEIRLGDSGVRARLSSWCCLLLLPLNSQTKLRLGDTTRNQKSMFGKGEERRFRAEIRLGDSGVRARLFSWCCLLLLPLNSQAKLRLGDTTRNQKSMFGKGE